jgi:hypothetical protein
VILDLFQEGDGMRHLPVIIAGEGFTLGAARSFVAKHA